MRVLRGLGFRLRDGEVKLKNYTKQSETYRPVVGDAFIDPYGTSACITLYHCRAIVDERVYICRKWSNKFKSWRYEVKEEEFFMITTHAGLIFKRSL